MALSLAKQAIDEVASLVKTKTPGGGASKLTEKHMAQGHFGRALALYRSARLMFYNALEITWQRALDGLQATPNIEQTFIWQERMQYKPQRRLRLMEVLPVPR